MCLPYFQEQESIAMAIHLSDFFPIFSCCDACFDKCRKKQEYRPRTVWIGRPLKSDQRTKFPANRIVNQKYNIFTFIPVVRIIIVTDSWYQSAMWQSGSAFYLFDISLTLPLIANVKADEIILNMESLNWHPYYTCKCTFFCFFFRFCTTSLNSSWISISLRWRAFSLFPASE